MPFPLLLLLLAGGAAAVVAASSSSSATPAPATGTLPPMDPRPTYEKFKDPILVCLEQTPDWTGKPYIRPGNFDVGLGYVLGAQNTADARIAALRGQVGTPRGDLSSFPATELGRIADNSYQQAQKLAVSLAQTYQDAAKWGPLAKSFGVPVQEIQKQAQDVNRLASGAQADFLKKAAKYEPIARSLMAAVGAYANGKRSKEDSIDLAVATVGNVLAVAAASVVPIIGAGVSLLVQSYATSRQAAKDKAKAECDQHTAEIYDVISKTLFEVFPFPVHAIKDLGGACGGLGYFLESIIRGNLLAFRKLSVRDKAAVSQWWALAQSTMGNPEVFAVFDRLGHGKVGRDGNPPFGNGFGYVGSDVGLYGGVLGSDEQVLLVAAPYAIANGYSVDYFAKALWAASGGWRTADPQSFLLSPGKDGAFTIRRASDDQYFAICPGARVPMNAWALNFAALSRDAAELVKVLPKG